MSLVLIFLLHEQNAGKLLKGWGNTKFYLLHQQLNEQGYVAAGLGQHNDRLGSEYVFLNDYVNLNSPVLKTIQLYPADCILYTDF